MKLLQICLYVIIHIFVFTLFAFSSFGISVFLIVYLHVSSVSLVAILSIIPMLCYYMVEDLMSIGDSLIYKVK